MKSMIHDTVTRKQAGPTTRYFRVASHTQVALPEGRIVGPGETFDLDDEELLTEVDLHWLPRGWVEEIDSDSAGIKPRRGGGRAAK